MLDLLESRESIARQAVVKATANQRLPFNALL